jgi:predicted RNA binding protein YcfA (HicA-like mRNA interferase family)
MKLPRDVDGPRLVKALSVLGYEASWQKGSHIRVTTQRDSENHEVIPYHDPVSIPRQSRGLYGVSRSKRLERGR